MLNVAKKYNAHFLPVVILLVFIILKIPALSYPYFWDELGVYARAGLYLHDHGLGLLPANLPPELSRGHPLLYSFITGIGYHIFGDGVVGGHITALILSVILLISIYYIAQFHWDKQVAILAMLLTLFQPLFFAQSVLVLPEITLTLFTLWALHFWFREKYIGYALMATAAILIKETAVVIPVVILTSWLINFFVQRKTVKVKFNWKQLLVFVPYLVFGGFLIIQKAQNGWYLFPLHEENIGLDLLKVAGFLKLFTIFIFLEQGRIIASVVLLILFAIALRFKLIKWHPFAIYLLVLFVGGILFSALNFFMNRYLVFVLLPLIILLANMLILVSRKFPAARYLITLILGAAIYSLYGFEIYPVTPNNANIQERFNYDEDMSYVAYLTAQQEATNFVMNKVQPGERIFANFPSNLGVADTRFGFTDKIIGKDFHLQPKRAYQDGFDFSMISDPGSYDQNMPAADSLVSLYSNHTGIANFDVWVLRFPNE